MTQHIPEKGAHLIRYYGWYSNKSRGLRAKAGAGQEQAATLAPETEPEADAAFRRRCRRRWAALLS